MFLKDWLRKLVLKKVGLVSDVTKPEDDRLTFINDAERLTRTRIHEYDIWYYGDSDELLNYYTTQNTFEYGFEPIYSRNKRNYFWSISATESDIKRTHSGQPRNIVDTLVNIVPFPTIKAGKLHDKDNPVNVKLKQIIKKSHLADIYMNEQLPLTLVEGWGCYKIVWDKDFSDLPEVVYYRAENVDFIYKFNKIIGIIFKDYYTDGDQKRYLKVETRSTQIKNGEKSLIIENKLFTTDKSGDYVQPIDFDAVPELKGTEEYIEIGPTDLLFAVPCIIFKNTGKAGGYGRSIFTGKTDLFDDLDQALSQASNTVRRSTVVEYFNSDFFERDPKTGMPKQPKSYDRKYSFFATPKNANGDSAMNEPVQVTQPQVNFQQYSDHAIQIMLQIIDGLMSPATMGIDIAKKDNAEAQREKEKVTIFTRNAICRALSLMFEDLCSQLLVCEEYMRTDKATVQEYDVSVKFSEFADDSYENKLEVLGKAYDSEIISDEMFMNKLYGDTLIPTEYERELAWLKEHHTKPRDDGMQGIAGGGANMPGLMQGPLQEGLDDDETEI